MPGQPTNGNNYVTNGATNNGERTTDSERDTCPAANVELTRL
jgi:hypothetical protein